MRIQLSDHFTYKKLLRFVLPSIVMTVFTSLYSIVDGFFVSNYAGKTAFAAINIAFPIMIEDMIALKKEVDEDVSRTNTYNLSPEEIAFFDALGDDPEVRELMKDETLVQIAKELVETVNDNMTVDWDIKRSSQAHMRMQIKRLLIKYNYPPNKSAKAVEIVVKQAELKCQEKDD